MLPMPRYDWYPSHAYRWLLPRWRRRHQPHGQWAAPSNRRSPLRPLGAVASIRAEREGGRQDGRSEIPNLTTGCNSWCKYEGRVSGRRRPRLDPSWYVYISFRFTRSVQLGKKPCRKGGQEGGSLGTLFLAATSAPDLSRSSRQPYLQWHDSLDIFQYFDNWPLLFFNTNWIKKLRFLSEPSVITT